MVDCLKAAIWDNFVVVLENWEVEWSWEDLTDTIHNPGYPGVNQMCVCVFIETHKIDALIISE